MSYYYYAHTLPGFGPIAWREIRLKTAAGQPEYRRIGKRNDLVLFEYRGNPRELLHLRSIEDIFFLIEHFSGISSDRAGLVQLKAVIQSTRYLDTALRIHKELHRQRTKRRTTFRVVVRTVGRHTYRRIDAQQAVEKGVLQRYNYSWKAVSTGADLEIWLNLLGSEAVIGLRLSGKAMRHRDYKLEHLPASLRPSAAFALVFLSDPDPNDVFLDPLCGAGTILIERALAGRYRLLLGGDIDPRAIAVVKGNIGPRYKPIALCRWDAAHLPLGRETVDKIATNLPFGEKMGSHEENIVLYERFFAEGSRVLRPGGRMVLLTSEQNLVENHLAQHPEFALVDQYQVCILGQPAMVYVMDTGEK